MKNLRFRGLLKQMEDLHEKKGKDYGTDVDPLQNLRRCEKLGVHPATGVVVRLQDKWERIENFFINGKLENESVLDSLID